MMMRHKQLGETGLSVTELCVGTSPLADMAVLYGYDVPEQRAVDTILRTFDGPINFLDTSNNYGNGNSERRIGEAIAARSGVPAGFCVATKVDPLPGSTDFSGSRVYASVSESLDRLGIDHLDLVYLHDPERTSFADAVAKGGPIEALTRLRQEGVIGHIGVAGGPPDLLMRYLQTESFEVVLNHNRFTLIDRSDEPLMDYAVDHQIAFVNAAPYGGGILVKGAAAQPKYAYRTATRETLARVAAIQEVCDRHAVPLAAAALQFSLRDPRVTSTVVGMSAPQRIEETLRLSSWPIPEQLWDELPGV